MVAKECPLLESKIGAAAEAALKLMHKDKSGFIEVVGRAADGTALNALILVEGPGTEDYLTVPSAMENLQVLADTGFFVKLDRIGHGWFAVLYQGGALHPWGDSGEGDTPSEAISSALAIVRATKEV